MGTLTNERRQALFPALRTVLVVCLLVAVAAPTHAELPKPRTGDIDLFLGEDAYNLGDYVKALRQFRIAAEKGKMSSGSAQFYLGVMYDNGQGVPQDYATAVKWYRKSAKQGYAKAQNNLGVMYDNGQGVPQDYAKAVQWYRKAAKQGNVKAQHNLGVIYGKGQGVPRDYAEAVQWYRKAAKQGYANAQFNLGVMYQKGLGVGKDPAEAALLFQRAAHAGLAEAQYSMGRMRHRGGVLVRDDRRALAWYRKAAAQGHPKARNHVKALDAAGVTPLPPSPNLELEPDLVAPEGPGGTQGVSPRPPAGPGPKKIPASAHSGSPAPVPSAAGAFRIQLGALGSAVEAEAEWRRLRRRHGDLLKALRSRIQRADLGAKGVFYRLQAGPLAGAGRAKGLCETLARRNVRCLVITP